MFFKIPSYLKKMHEIFAKNGFQAYLVGGAVRDVLMGKTPHDWDLTTNATPQDVMRIFPKVIPTGFEHGTVTVHFQNQEIEVTTFRTESGYSDGRHPDSVNYAATIEEDLGRRDFTMNAIAVNLENEEIVDPYSGREDIKKKIICTVGKPEERFLEDGLRPVRALRFASQLGFKIADETYSAISKPEILKKIDSISRERFRDELMKLLKAEKPSFGLKMMEETKVLDLFIPELSRCRGFSQKDDRGYHIFDVLDHCLYACDGAPAEKPLVRLASLFHDIGKSVTRTERHENGNLIYNFYGHEKKSAQMAFDIMTRLKFSNAEIEKVTHLIEMHMFNYESQWTDSAVRRFLIKAGKENIEDLIDLRLSDMYGKYNESVRLHDAPACSLLAELQDRIEKLEKENAALSIKDLKINGRDLMALGITPGKHMGTILNELFETVTDDPNINDKEALSVLALNIWKRMNSVIS